MTANYGTTCEVKLSRKADSSMLARTQKFNIIPISWLVSAQHNVPLTR